MHGFGVNCIDTLVLGEHRFLIASGGDDQNISLMLLEKKGAEVVKVLHCTNYAHSSSVKGLVLFKQVEDGRPIIKLCSSGYDQRFKCWTATLDKESITLQKVSQRRHCLSDMNHMCKSGNKIVLVG